jgi:hypothetical protein
MLLEYLTEALFEVSRVVIPSFWKRMQSPEARLSPSSPVLVSFDAIQQHDCRIACPDSTALCAVSCAHAKDSRIPATRALSTGARRNAEKAPLNKKAFGNIDFAAQTKLFFTRFLENAADNQSKWQSARR